MPGTGSHAEFLFEQVRSCLRQLHAQGNLQARDYADITSTLDRVELKDEDPSQIMSAPEESLTAEQLGKRNEWMRNTVGV